MLCSTDPAPPPPLPRLLFVLRRLRRKVFESNPMVFIKPRVEDDEVRMFLGDLTPHITPTRILSSVVCAVLLATASTRSCLTSTDIGPHSLHTHAQDVSAIMSASKRLSRRWDVCPICLKPSCKCPSEAVMNQVIKREYLYGFRSQCFTMRVSLHHM